MVTGVPRLEYRVGRMLVQTSNATVAAIVNRVLFPNNDRIFSCRCRRDEWEKPWGSRSSSRWLYEGEAVPHHLAME